MNPAQLSDEELIRLAVSDSPVARELGDRLEISNHQLKQLQHHLSVAQQNYDRLCKRVKRSERSMRLMREAITKAREVCK